MCQHRGMDERRIDVGGMTLAVAEAGRGGRPLLLLHGFCGAKEDFTEWLDPLADAGWHAVAPDHRGHGSSDKPEGEDAYSFAILTDDALALADALGWERFVLLGHSMGGMVAERLAIARPDRLAGLILMDTGHGPVEGLDPAMTEAAARLIRTGGVGAFADLVSGRPSPLDTPAHRRLVEDRPGYAEFGEAKLRATADGLWLALSAELVSGDDTLADLRRLPADLPALVMVGEQDRPFLEASSRMADAVGGASLVVIPDAGHSPQFENPDAWWRALSTFLAGVPAVTA